MYRQIGTWFGDPQHFGERRHPHELACTFYANPQYNGEAIQLYASRLQRSFERLTSQEAALGKPVTPSVTLRQKFVSGLRDPSLQGNLFEKVAANNQLTFMYVREVTLCWAANTCHATPKETVVACVRPSPLPTHQNEVSRQMLAGLFRFQDQIKGLQQQLKVVSATAQRPALISDYCHKPGYK